MKRYDNAERSNAGRFGLICAAMVAAIAFAGEVSPAAAQSCDLEANNVCGFVWNDANNNGIQDADEKGIADVTVTFTSVTDATESYPITTGICEGVDADGNAASESTCGVYHAFLPAGSYNVTVNPTSITQGTLATVANSPDAEETDSDGIVDSSGGPNTGFSTVTNVTVSGYPMADNDFGFYTVPKPLQVGTGTPGYWKNHPDDWPVTTIVMGGKTYTVSEAIAVLGKVSKDKSITMFSSLLAAKLNLLNGTTPDCIIGSIELADEWMAAHPANSNVTGSSAAWAQGEPWHKAMDAYNNGLMCAPHRN